MAQPEPFPHTTPPSAGTPTTLGTGGPAVPDTRHETETTLSMPPSEVLIDGRYTILRFHARGGMGEVSVALDRELQREVAYKQIQPRFAADGESKRRFILEAEVTGRLEHPGIVPIYGLGCHADGRPYYAMRFIQGESLREAIRAFHLADQPQRDAGERELALRGLLRRFIDVCNAVAFAHDRGWLHRDLKPANVMLGKFGETLVVDWGLARPLRTDSGEKRPGDHVFPSSALLEETAQTEAGAVMGTPAYMSPEQAQGDLGELGIRSDVYSLGAVLHELLTGKVPFEGSLSEVLEAVKAGRLKPARERNPRVPAALEAVVARATALRPEGRYGTATELAAEVERWLADEPVQAHQEPWSQRVRRWGRRHRPLVTGLAVLLLTASVALGVGLVLVDQQRRRAEQAEQAKDEALQRETREREQKERLAGMEHAQRLRAERTSALLLLDLALEPGESANAALSLLWLAGSLQEAPPEEELQRTIRTNLAGWRRHVHPLRAVLPHSGAVLAAVFSPDSRAIVTVQEGDVLRLWEARSGLPLGLPQSGLGPIKRLSFSPGGRFVAAGDGVFDLRTGKSRKEWPPADSAWADLQAERLSPLHWVSVVEFQGAGSRSRAPQAVLRDHRGNTTGAWAVTTDRALADRIEAQHEGIAVTIDGPDNGWLLHAERDRGLRLQRLDAVKPQPITLPHRSEILGATFDPTRRVVLTGNYDGTARLWEVATGTPLGAPLFHRSDVTTVAFSSDGGLMLTGSKDGTARVWEVAGGWAPRATLTHPGPVYAVSFRPDGKVLATGGQDRAVRLWDAASGKLSAGPFAQTSPLGIAYRPSSGLTTSFARLPRLLGPDHNEIRGLAFSPDGRSLLVGCGYPPHLPWIGRTQVIDPATGRPAGPSFPQVGRVNAVAFTPDGRSAVAGSYDGTASLWSLRTGEIEADFFDARTPDPMPILTVAVSPDGETVLTGGYDRTVQRWATRTGKPVSPSLRHNGPVNSVAFSPDGRLILAGSGDGTAQAWDARTAEPSGPPLRHPGEVLAVAIGPDSRTALTGCADGKVRLWDLSTGRWLVPPLLHKGPVRAVAFAAGGGLIATGSEDGEVRLWDVPSPLAGDADRLSVWVEARTGLRREKNNRIRILDAASWEQSRVRLATLGGDP